MSLVGVLKIFVSAEFYAATIRLMTPLMIAAIGGIICERAGILNMALESMMLSGAYFGFMGSYITGNVWMGVLSAMLGGMVFSVIMGFMSIKLKVNQVVVAMGLNTLATGVTSTIFRFMFETNAGMAHCEGFTKINIPVLSEIPFIGKVFFNQYPLTYIGIALMILINWFLFHTSRGLELRAAGENPLVLAVAGVNVIKIRWLALLATGAMGGLAGSCLTLNGLETFYDGLSGGRGFIAYAAIVFGKWNPFGAALATVLFGAGDALQLRLQAMDFGIPYHFLMMAPYLITFFALVFFMGPSRGPAASNRPYVPDKRHKIRKGGNK